MDIGRLFKTHVLEHHAHHAFQKWIDQLGFITRDEGLDVLVIAQPVFGWINDACPEKKTSRTVPVDDILTADPIQNENCALSTALKCHNVGLKTGRYDLGKRPDKMPALLERIKTCANAACGPIVDEIYQESQIERKAYMQAWAAKKPSELFPTFTAVPNNTTKKN